MMINNLKVWIQGSNLGTRRVLWKKKPDVKKSHASLPLTRSYINNTCFVIAAVGGGDLTVMLALYKYAVSSQGFHLSVEPTLLSSPTWWKRIPIPCFFSIVFSGLTAWFFSTLFFCRLCCFGAGNWPGKAGWSQRGSSSRPWVCRARSTYNKQWLSSPEF